MQVFRSTSRSCRRRKQQSVRPAPCDIASVLGVELCRVRAIFKFGLGFTCGIFLLRTPSNTCLVLRHSRLGKHPLKVAATRTCREPRFAVRQQSTTPCFEQNAVVPLLEKPTVREQPKLACLACESCPVVFRHAGQFKDKRPSAHHTNFAVLHKMTQAKTRRSMQRLVLAEVTESVRIEGDSCPRRHGCSTMTSTLTRARD